MLVNLKCLLSHYVSEVKPGYIEGGVWDFENYGGAVFLIREKDD